MYKHYAVMFLAPEKRRPSCDIFYARSANEARRDFREVYRHGEYTILAVTEMPEEWERR